MIYLQSLLFRNIYTAKDANQDFVNGCTTFSMVFKDIIFLQIQINVSGTLYLRLVFLFKQNENEVHFDFVDRHIIGGER